MKSIITSVAILCVFNRVSIWRLRPTLSMQRGSTRTWTRPGHRKIKRNSKRSAPTTACSIYGLCTRETLRKGKNYFWFSKVNSLPSWITWSRTGKTRTCSLRFTTTLRRTLTLCLTSTWNSRIRFQRMFWKRWSTSTRTKLQNQEIWNGSTDNFWRTRWETKCRLTKIRNFSRSKCFRWPSQCCWITDRVTEWRNSKILCSKSMAKIALSWEHNSSKTILIIHWVTSAASVKTIFIKRLISLDSNC